MLKGRNGAQIMISTIYLSTINLEGMMEGIVLK